MKKVFSKVPVSKIMLTVLSASAFLLPLSAGAEVREGSFELTPFVGYSLFENRQNLEDSIIYGGRVGYNFTKHFGLEGTIEFLNTHVDDKTRTGSKEGQFRSPMDKIDLAFYHVDAVYHFMPENRFTPFVIAGYGGAHYSPKISNRDMSIVDFGVGAKYSVSENVALRFDVRDNMVLDESYHNVNATVGVVFALGGKSKPAKAAAECPVPVDTTAPTVSLTIPVDEATDASNNRNVSVAFSEAMDPATINGSTFIVKQGMAPVTGRVSSPTATSANFTQEDDLAPGSMYTATVTTGAKDLAGNALAKNYVWSFKTAQKGGSKVVTKVVIVNKFVMLEDTHFQFDKATLTPAGKSMLDQNIKIMKDNPELKVRVAGYTSAAGTAAYNQDLSERRAATVRTYLIEQGGITSERLDTIGYGATRPAVYEPIPSDLESKAAKANMRVLFEVIVK